MTWVSSFLIILAAAICAGAIYVYNDNPYSGKLLPASSFTLGGSAYRHKIPYFTEVYYPDVAGEYAAIFFIPGLFGLVPPQLYVDTLSRLAGHGFVVMAPSTDLPTVNGFGGRGNGAPTSEPPGAMKDKMRETLEWLRYNMNSNVLPEHKTQARVDWSYVGLGGHSAGASTILEMVMNDTSIAKAVAYMEPFSYDLRAPFDSGLPSLCYGTQYSEEAPRCCIPPWDFVHFYKYLGCPKIQMNVTGFGHCDILDNDGWELCHLAHFCKTVKTNDRDVYRRAVSGIMAAFFSSYVQGNRDQLRYVVNTTLIPVNVNNFHTDLDC